MTEWHGESDCSIAPSKAGGETKLHLILLKGESKPHLWPLNHLEVKGCGAAAGYPPVPDVECAGEYMLPEGQGSILCRMGVCMVRYGLLWYGITDTVWCGNMLRCSMRWVRKHYRCVI